MSNLTKSLTELREDLKARATRQAQEWAAERGVCGPERFKMMYDNALIKLTAEECASLAYKSVPDGDIAAMTILYEFDINGARSLK